MEGLTFPDKDALLVLGIMAVIYKEGGDRQLLLGLLLLFLMINGV